MLNKIVDQNYIRRILNAYHSTSKLLSNYSKNEEYKKLRLAFNILLTKYQDSGSDYEKKQVFDSIEMVNIGIENLNLGMPSVIAILLYQPFLQKKISEFEIENDFSKSNLLLIKSVKDISSIDTNKASKQPEEFIRLILSTAEDVRSILIKLIEKLYLIRNFKSLDKNEIIQLSTEVYYLYVPIAHRIGLYNLKKELEDLSFKNLKPEDYKYISNLISESETDREGWVQSFIEPIEILLNAHNINFEIKWRTKSVHSIYTKMQTKKVSFNEVYDLFAVRVILKSTKSQEKVDCWHAFSIITNIYQPDIKRLRDWISVPKETGYESLHTTVLGPDNKWVEVQIRTERMDEIAEKGLAAHWKYKGGKSEVHYESWVAKIRSILENPEKRINELISGSELKKSTGEIFVFTRNGDLKKLKEGSTVLDFAFEIHTDVGFHASSARLNWKIVPLKQVLHNGDQVEIITAKNQKPKHDWLNFVVSTRAKNKIKRLLAEEEFNDAEIGKGILKRKFKNWKISFNDETINQIIKFYKKKNALEVYSGIAREKIDLFEIKKILIKEESSDKENLYEYKKPEPLNAGNISQSNSEVLEIDNSIKNLNFSFAKCCKPTIGSKIFGFVTIKDGISIHLADCKNGLELLRRFPYRKIEVRWAQKEKEASILASIKILGTDQTGILNRITDIISNEMKININSVSIQSNVNSFEGVISFIVSSKEQSNMILKKVRKINGVNKAVLIQ